MAHTTFSLWQLAERFGQDVRYAWRLMRRRPAFTAVAAITLALGIGANTAIFSLVDAVLLRTLPVADPAQLVVIDHYVPTGETRNLSYPLFQRLRGETTAFDGMFAVLDGVNRMDVTLSTNPGASAASVSSSGGAPEPAGVQLVSGDYFPVLGVPAFMGRTLTRDDDGAAGTAVAVVRYDFWQQRLGGDPRVLGRTITISKQPFTIVGIAPPGFFGVAVGLAPDVWVPMTMQPVLDRGRSRLDDPRTGWLRVMARLQPGVTHGQANAALAVLVDRLQNPSDAMSKDSRHVTSLRVSDGSLGLSRFRDQFSLSLRILAVAVAIVLLIACANVSNLLLARATARQREVAVRLAIGAGRARLVAQFLTESLMLAMLGGALGLLFAWWGSTVLLVLLSSDGTPLPIDVAPDARLLAFTLAISLATVIVVGLVPALSASRVDVHASLKQMTAVRLSGVRLSGARSRGRLSLSPILIVTQVALSLLLLTGAALFLQTLHNLRTRDLGFVTEALLQARIEPEVSGYRGDQIPDLSRRILERLAAAPGVQSVSVAHSGFATGTSRTCCIAIEGRVFGTSQADRNAREVRTIGIGPDYFRTMSVPLRLGRDFALTDMPNTIGPMQGAVIVNDAFVRQYLGSGHPIGRRIGWGDPPKVKYDLEVVGVVADAVYDDPRAVGRPLIYFPSTAGRMLVVRAGGGADAIASLSTTIRREIGAIDPNLLILGIRPVSAEVERALVREKLLARLSGFFGVLAVGLAAIGLYGLMAYAVVNRTREIGIRMALGASRESVLRGEIWSALRLVLLGVGLGVPVALAAGSLIANQLFGVTPTDPRALALAAALLALVGAAAAYAPARRASRVDPMFALRAE